MSKHTPGTWVARPDPNGRPGDYCIGLDDDCSPPDYVAVCNYRDARLIAAAPELLEALKECASRLEIHIVHTGDLIAHMKAVSAIEKATGESA